MISFSYNDGGRSSYFKGGAGDCVPKKIYHQYLLKKGFKWESFTKIGNGCTKHLNKDELPQEGVYILRLSRHLSCLKEGIIEDTFNPSREGIRCVYGWYRKQH